MWNIASECVAGVFVCIIFVYSYGSHMVPTVKNLIFQGCLTVTFIGIVSNIASTILIYNYTQLPWALVYTVTMIYFFATPLMGAMYLFYIVAMVYENHKLFKPIMIITSIPYIIYCIMVVLNISNKKIFYLDPETGYGRGPWMIIAYLIFYSYCFLCFVIVTIGRKILTANEQRILYSFPAICVLVIIVQYLMPSYILTGSAAACALLIVYLFLQNKRITVDLLTGISNRQAFLNMIELECKRKLEFSVAVVSLKDFKFINDKFGQKNGDMFIREISLYLRKTFGDNCLYRYGGDEFAIILNINRAIVPVELDKIIQRFSQPWGVESCKCMIYMGIGVVDCPEITSTQEDIINGLEYAVHQSKSQLEPITYCTEEMIQKIKRHNMIIGLFKENAIASGMYLEFQPIVSTSEHKYVLAESLLRLNNPVIGMVYPDEFIPITEETGVIVEITYWILDQVCQIIKTLIKKNIEFEGINVNLSVLQFLQEDLVERIVEIIERNQIPFNKIKFEITESVVNSNYEIVEAIIHRLNEYGIRFSLDDFGTGYSNISSVIDLPFDTIKLDKSLIWTSMTNEKCAVFVEAMSKAFHSVGIRVLAEGVETKEHFDFVTHCNCDFIQGFMYARPSSLEVLEDALKKDSVQN